MAKRQSTALAKNEPAPLAVVDELDGLLGTDGFDDGLGEIDAGDVKLAALVFNMKGMDRAGDPIAPNTFFDTLTETTRKKVHLVLLQLHKSHLMSSFDNAKNETVVHCRSFDRVTGTMEDGTTRACNGCPEKEWRTVDGKRTRNCAEVWNMFAVDTETATPCVVRFKKTSQPAIKDYLNKYFIGKRVVSAKSPDGKVVTKRMNYPLYAFATIATLRMDDGGKYAIPELERGELLPREQIEAYMAESENAREYMQRALERVETQAESAEGRGDSTGDDSFNTDDFADTTA